MNKIFFSFLILLAISGTIYAQELPLEELILGEWDIDIGESGIGSKGEKIFFYEFKSDHRMWSGNRYSDTGFYGNWSLSGNVLTITLGNGYPMPDNIRGKIVTILIKIIDKDNIILLHEKGSLLDFGEERLSRVLK